MIIIPLGCAKLRRRKDFLSSSSAFIKRLVHLGKIPQKSNFSSKGLLYLKQTSKKEISNFAKFCSVHQNHSPPHPRQNYHHHHRHHQMQYQYYRLYHHHHQSPIWMWVDKKLPSLLVAYICQAVQFGNYAENNPENNPKINAEKQDRKKAENNTEKNSKATQRIA